MMPLFRKLLCALMALLFSNAAFANPIYYEVADLGAGRFQYDYTVDNQTASPIEEFTVWFDVSVYDNLLIVANPSPDWDGITVPGDPLLPDPDGYADWLAFGSPIAPGQLLSGFSVSFDWLGNGTPGLQFFEIVDPFTFDVLSDGFTQPLPPPPTVNVSEPPSLTVMLLGLLMMTALARRRVRHIATISTLALTGLATITVAPPVIADESSITAVSRDLVSRQRVGRTAFDYTYRLTIDNGGQPLSNVVGTVTSTSAYTMIVDGEVVFGDIGSGTVQSGDTFTIRHNRRVPFDPAALVWSFSADPVVIGDNAPVITSSPLTRASVDAPYTYDVDATDADAGDTLNYSLSMAPAGMAIDPVSGLIQWVPSTSTTVDVDIRVTDSTGRFDRQVFLVTVDRGADDGPPVIEPIADQALVAGATLSLQASATDPDGDAVRYGLAAAPAGMTINPMTGAIRWIPGAGQAGQTMVTVSAADPGGQSAETGFTVTVRAEPANMPPTIAPVDDQTVNIGEAVQITLSASDGDINEILTFTLAGAPAGLQFDVAAGEIRWMPTSSDIGSHALIATVTDSAGATATTGFVIDVLAPAQAPVAVDDRFTLAQSGSLFIGAPGVLANDRDANGDLLTASVTNYPALGSLDMFPGDGSFTYTPPAIPPIQVGLNLQCSYLSTYLPGTGIATGDIDGDGDIELVLWGIVTLGSPELVIVDGATCAAEKFPLGGGEYIGEPSTRATATLVNLDDDPDLEIVFPYERFHPSLPHSNASKEKRLMALNRDGTPLWNTATHLSDAVSFGGGHSLLERGSGPVPVDLDGDGDAELLKAWTADGTFSRRRNAVVAYDGRTGAILWEYVGPQQRYSGDLTPQRNPAVADLDLDGKIEIIWGRSVLNADGSLKFLLPADNDAANVPLWLVTAVANFDDDPYAEIIAYDNFHHYLFEHTGALKWKIPRLMAPGPGAQRAYSLITVAELDGDSLPEYVVLRQGLATSAGAPYGAEWALYAYDTDGSELWNQFDLGLTIKDVRQSDVAPVAFDFDRDGIDELVTQHPGNTDGTSPSSGLFIFSGADGSVIARDSTGLSSDHTASPLTIADVDGDGAAEIIGSHSYPFAELRVFEGLPGNPFPAARPIRNHTSYQPAHVNADGSLPTYIQPHWLIPGMNKFFAAPVVPGEEETTIDSFEYVANDGALDSNVANVDITLSIVNAPRIASAPLTGASPGFAYQYGALATDADFGDTFSWTLVDAPAGMTVDAFGIVSWLPQATDLGTQRVNLIVTDSDGNTDSQSFTINVAPPVIVPDLAGNDAAGAATMLEAAGLVSGNVTESFSLTVPAGEVLSQSVAAGSSSAAGAFVDYVISLGPPPIFVPELGSLSVTVAEAALLDVGLALGNVTYVNDVNVPRNLIVSQSIGEGTNVAAGTSVDIVVSGGPALSLRLAQTLIGNGEGIEIDIQAFDVTGNPLALPADLAVSVVAGGDASGTLPTVSGNQLLTGADTQGGYTLSVTSVSLGLDVSEAFLVSSFFNNGELQRAYGTFSSQLQKANALVSGIVDALGNGDLPAVQALGVELRTLRGQLDLEALRMTPAVALESGFLPDTAPDMETASDMAFAATLPPVIAAVRDSRLFLEQLNAVRARNDDVRARLLNMRLEQTIDLLDPDTLTRRGIVVHAADLHRLLSVEIPRLLAADLDRALSILVAEGLLASVPEDPAAFYARQIMPLHTDLEAVQPAFFTAIGMMSATSIRSTIIDIVYKPILQAILKNAQNLVIEGLAKALSEVRNIPGIVTGASQSFHTFELDHSIVEAYSYYGYPEGYIVQLVGPTLLSDMVSALSGLKGVKFSSMKDTLTSFAKIKKTADQATTLLQEQFAQTQPVWVENGCVFDIVEPECQQLSFVDGLPVVYKGSNFPAPVLIIVYDVVAGTVALDNFLFFPKK